MNYGKVAIQGLNILCSACSKETARGGPLWQHNYKNTIKCKSLC